MAGKIVFCTGGSRSGKSDFALNLANALPGPKLFVATAEAIDAEMTRRIQKHKKSRAAEWQCLEVPMNKARDISALTTLAASGGNAGAVLVDCVSTWVSACQETWVGAQRDFEDGVKDLFTDYISALKKLNMPIFMVSIEAGMGLLPMGSETRLFLDTLGSVNQIAANAASEAYFCVSGLAMKLK